MILYIVLFVFCGLPSFRVTPLFTLSRLPHTMFGLVAAISSSSLQVSRMRSIIFYMFPHYPHHRQQLEQVDEEKDLGVLIDNELKFHKQTAMTIKKGKSVLGLINKSFAVINKRTLPLLYKALVRPHLEYGNVIWGPFFRGDIIAIEKVQRTASKLVPLLKYFTYEERLRTLDIPSLAHRRRRGDMIYT